MRMLWGIMVHLACILNWLNVDLMLVKVELKRLMRKHDIKAKRARRHKRTYEHRDVIAPVENILNREFI